MFLSAKQDGNPSAASLSENFGSDLSLPAPFRIFGSALDRRRFGIKNQASLFFLPSPFAIFGFTFDRMRFGIAKSENRVFDLSLPSPFAIFAAV